jgi:predicted CoA-substrate-specific enzyme activase
MATCCAGIDVGSATTKAVVIDAEGAVVGHHVVRSGASFGGAAEGALSAALEMAGLRRDDLGAVIGTGYGRTNVAGAADTRTEIACHGRGAYHHFPRAITVVDIGGQDNKVIELDEAGKRISFKMNRKCAAGTGAFIEEIAHRLDVPLGELNGLALRSTTALSLNSFCTVFAATEVLARIREGVAVEDLARAAFRSVARRIMESHPLKGEVVLTGGVVAHNSVVVDLLAEARGAVRPLLPPQPQLVGALGAALFARDMFVHEHEREREDPR